MCVRTDSSRLAAWGAHGGLSGNWGEARPSAREQWWWWKALLPDTPQHHQEHRQHSCGYGEQPALLQQTGKGEVMGSFKAL